VVAAGASPLVHVEEIVVNDSVDCNLFPHAAEETAKMALALCEDVFTWLH
jgi:hypothetical protein